MIVYAVLIRIYAGQVEAVLLTADGTYLGAATGPTRDLVTQQLLAGATAAGHDLADAQTSWVENYADAPEGVRAGYAAAVGR